ncbi:MAG: class I SAM-dependent methyltransferase, partial [Blastocatellia bacterium]
NNSIRELRRLFDRVYTALEPGGVFVFDLAGPGRGTGPRQKHREGSDWAVLVEVEEHDNISRLTRRITSFRKIGKLFRRDTEIHHLQLFRRSEIATELRRVGFRVRIVGAYGDRPLIEGCVGFVARKPGGRAR